MVQTDRSKLVAYVDYESSTRKMKKVLSLVKKRQSSSHSSTPKSSRSTPNLSAASRASISSTATSSILQFQKSPSPSKSLGDLSKTKYNNLTKEKDKSLSKLHLAVYTENLDKVKKYVKRGFDPDLQNPETGTPTGKSKRLKSVLGKEENLVNR